MNNVQMISKKLELLSEEDYTFVTALIDRLIDPDWVMLSEEDIKDIEESRKDFEKGVYFTHEEVWGD